jgi:hypothetical protein
VQVDDMSKSYNLNFTLFIAATLKTNITDLSKVILNCRKLTDENMSLLELARQELNKLLGQQMKNLENGFNELIRKIEEKKLELIVDYEK